jgi:hypothetical protein
MSLVVPIMECRDVETSSARNRTRKRICEILRHCGNLDPAKNPSLTPRAQSEYMKMIGVQAIDQQ